MLRSATSTVAAWRAQGWHRACVAINVSPPQFFESDFVGHVARALEVAESRGFMKAVVDAETNQILGAAVLGIEGGEIMSQLQLAMMGKLPYPVLRDAVFAHPTLAESLNNLFTNFQDK